MGEPSFAEDLEVGATVALGDYEVGLEEITQFSARWDPQSFHADGPAAAAGFFGGPIASGVHSVAILQRLTVLGAYRGWAVLAGRRIREVGFEAPLRPGAVVTGSVTVEAVDRVSAERSLVTVTGTLHHGETLVITATQELYVLNRPA